MYSCLVLIISSQTVFSQNEDWFTIVNNDIPSDTDLETSWGFSAWIQKGNEVILFGKGASWEILNENLKKLNFDPAEISVVVIFMIMEMIIQAE